MLHKWNVVVAMSLALLAGRLAHASPTMIDAQPDGKRVLLVDGKEIERPDSKTILWIDGNDILANPHDPATLVVDDDDVRPAAGGLILARFDGEDLRHGKGGKVIINYHHPDICPDSASNRIYTVDGPELTKQQLVAVLYVLKPELFKLTDAEVAEQKKAYQEAGEESDRLAAADQLAGAWDVLSGSGPVAKIGKGSITFAPKVGDVYPATFDYAKAGGPSWTGVATSAKDGFDTQVWAAFGTAKTIGLCVYDIDGGTLSGTWYPWYADGDAKNLGTEKLTGPAKLGGEYKIVDAKAPTTGAAYAGTVTITPAEMTGASDNEKPYLLVWKLGDVKVYGIGIVTGKRLYVASGAGPDINIAKLKISNGAFNGDYFKLGAKEMGGMAAMRQ